MSEQLVLALSYLIAMILTLSFYCLIVLFSLAFF